MTSDDQFFIDGKPYKLEHSPEKVSTLLHLAGTSVSDDAIPGLGRRHPAW